MKNIKLFDYQEEMVLRIESAFGKHQSVMAQMPTGTGKTFLLAAVVETFLRENRHESVWIVAHRRELVSQIEETLKRFFSSREANPIQSLPIKACSIQWLTKHLEEMTDVPGMIVIDEAHHALAKTYKVLWERFPKTRFLGLTATPCRLSGRGFMDLFEVLVQSWNIPRFIKEGRLATYDFVSIKASSKTQKLIDSLKKKGADGDYQTKEMDMVLNKKPSIERLYQSFCEYGKNRKGIVYAIDIDHAKAIAEYYCEHGVNAVAIDSKTPYSLRREIIDRFKNTSTSTLTDVEESVQVLVNVDVFSEGFDCPDVEFVQLARPTLSLAKYLQMVGRGLRVANGKNCYVIIDNVGLYRVFGLPSQVWDWQAMFEGRIKKRKNSAVMSMAMLNGMEGHICEAEKNVETEMMVVVTHEQLANVFERQRVDDEIAKRRDKVLRGGMGKVEFIGKDLVRLSEKSNGRVAYVDLVNMNYMEGKNISQPKVVRVGGVEFLKYDQCLHSRTHTVMTTYYYKDCIDNMGFYSRYLPNGYDCKCKVLRVDKSHLGGRAVIFLHDEPADFYWLSGELMDGSIVVMDEAGLYYWVEKGKPKVYIGCCNYPEDKKKLNRQIAEIVAVTNARTESRQRERIASIAMDDINPYKVGHKWGMHGSSGRIIVPPIYRKVRKENGFFPFEKLVSHWGVMDRYGKVVVEPKYDTVVVTADGKALVSCITGKSQVITLK